MEVKIGGSACFAVQALDSDALRTARAAASEKEHHAAWYCGAVHHHKWKRSASIDFRTQNGGPSNERRFNTLRSSKSHWNGWRPFQILSGHRKRRRKIEEIK
jgi:hypothetical protein